MNLLFTGASGFLGKNTLPILKQQFETVHTLGLTENDRFCVNLSREIPQLSQSYDVVLHAAGKAHVVPRTEAEKKE
jgi:nucleoside-diphosphate-sugar epimerase